MILPGAAVIACIIGEGLIGAEHAQKNREPFGSRQGLRIRFLLHNIVQRLLVSDQDYRRQSNVEDIVAVFQFSLNSSAVDENLSSIGYVLRGKLDIAGRGAVALGL